MRNNEQHLTNQEEDIIALAATICLQADTMPRHLVEQHGMILDFYLEACPTQTHNILRLIGSTKVDEWDD